MRRGDEDAFSLLFHHHYQALCCFARRYVGDFDTAESLVQGVFVNLWDRREVLHIRVSMKSYLFGAIKNACLDHVNHESFSLPPEIVREWSSNCAERPDIQLESQEIMAAVQSAVDELPSKRREIFLMAKDNGLSYQEIAEIQNISVNTVKTQIKRALKALSSSLRYMHTALLLIRV